MTAKTPSQEAGPAVPERPRRKRHLLRWILVGLAALVVLGLAAAMAAVELQPVAAPLKLPSSAAAPAGPLAGTWRVTSGSVAGFRVQQTFLGATSDVAGRTGDVTGAAVVAGDRVVAARVRVGLRALTSNGKSPAPQYGQSLDTGHHPYATLTLVRPLPLGAAFATGAPARATATARLTLHGVTRDVRIPLIARRDAATTRIAGRFPVAFAPWNIAQPKGYGALGSLADHGDAEFLLVLRHR